jgi:rhodanese-related sulfurtransferase
MRTHQLFQGREIEYDEVSLDQAEDLRAEGATVVDVRNHDERGHKHVPNSIHIPLPELAGRLDEVPEGKVLLICARGQRSAVAAEMIELGTGRSDVSSIAEGTDGWEAAGKPINRG